MQLRTNCGRIIDGTEEMSVTAHSLHIPLPNADVYSGKDCSTAGNCDRSVFKNRKLERPTGIKLQTSLEFQE